MANDYGEGREVVFDLPQLLLIHFHQPTKRSLHLALVFRRTRIPQLLICKKEKEKELKQRWQLAGPVRLWQGNALSLFLHQICFYFKTSTSTFLLSTKLTR